VATKKKPARRRPVWVTDTERVASGSLVVVSRPDGTSAGFLLPTTSLRDRDEASESTEMVAAGG